MKKSLGKRILSGVTSALLGISALTQAVPLNNGGLLKAVAAESESPKYPNAYTVENLLTDYNVVSFGDLTQNDHIVGAILAAGTLTSDIPGGAFFGDAAKSPSYIGNVEKLAGYSANNFFNNSGDNSYTNDFSLNGVYYLESENNVVNTTFSYDGISYPAFTQINEPYFDAASAKASVSAWSEDKRSAEDAWVVSETELEQTGGFGWMTCTLKIPVSDKTPKNIVIPEEIYNSLTEIRFIGEDGQSPDINKLSQMGLTITVEGQPEPLNSAMDPSTSNPNFSLNFLVKYEVPPMFPMGMPMSKPLEGAFKGINGDSNGGQVNLMGMNLVWNFPDATGELYVSPTTGHIVAPNAKVVILGGEGGVIADEVVIGQEIHYLPYNKNTQKDKSIIIAKMIESGQKVISGSKFKLSITKEPPKDLNGVKIDGIEVENGLQEIVFDGNSMISGLKNGTYSVEEIEAPDGYTCIPEFTFTIDKETITLNDAENADGVKLSGNTFRVVDEESEISISKVDIADEKTELPGAKLILSGEKITDEDEKKITITDEMVPNGFTSVDSADNLTSGQYNITDGVLTWVSYSDEMVLTKLPDGKYKLTELIAPDEYFAIGESIYENNVGEELYRQLKDSVINNYTKNLIEELQQGFNNINNSFISCIKYFKSAIDDRDKYKANIEQYSKRKTNIVEIDNCTSDFMHTWKTIVYDYDRN